MYASLPAQSVKGSIGTTTVYGHNQYGPWVSQNKWQTENWVGLGGPCVDAVNSLSTVWRSMSSAEKNTWAIYARRQRLPLYTAFLKINIPRVLNGLEPLITH